MRRRNRRSPTLAPPSITRRDFVNGTLAAAGLGLLAGLPGCRRPLDYPLESLVPDDWYGFGGVGDYRLSHGNTPAAVTLAHRVRDGELAAAAPISGVAEEYDLVIIGGGMAGLGAALEQAKRRRPGQTCLLLDNHPIFGGEAKENEFEVDGTTLIAPQGSNGFFIPPAVADPAAATGDARYYAELGLPRELPYREWPATEKPLGFCRDNYGYLVVGLDRPPMSLGHFFRAATAGGAATAAAGATAEAGTWALDMWGRELENTPLPAAARRALLAWYHAGAARTYASEAEARRRLDSMSYEQFLVGELGLGVESARHADLFLAAALGLGSDAVSAYAAYGLPMPGFTAPLPATMERQSFPGGNSGYARYFLKTLIPEAIAGGRELGDVVTGRIDLAALDRPGAPLRLRLDATAVAVEHEGRPDAAARVRIVYARDGRLHLARARAAILATGGWINRHIVRDLPEELRLACGRFRHAPFLVANVALTNWRFLYRLGITAAVWERSVEGFGRTCNLRRPMVVGRHQPPLDPDRPAVLTFYVPFYYPGLALDDQLRLGRAELLGTSYPEYERRIVWQLNELFAGAGFDAARDLAGIVLNRWGHAYSVPYPGFFGGAGDQPAPRDLLRRGYGRVAFAHSELAGHQHWGPAADEGRRAVGQLTDRLAG